MHLCPECGLECDCRNFDDHGGQCVHQCLGEWGDEPDEYRDYEDDYN
jgi:hypothetical protein